MIAARRLVAGLALCALVAHAQAPERPQLGDAEAARWRIDDYLSDGGQVWRPARVDAATTPPDFIVATDGTGTHRSVQAAIDALPPAASGLRMHHILVRPGTYRGQVCAQGKVPFSLRGAPGHAASTVVVAGHSAGQPKRPGIDAANPCEPALASDRYGTSGSASVALYGDGIVVAHLTIANDATSSAPQHQSQGAQAVALMLRGDRILVEDARILGYQDTLYARAAAPHAPARMLVRNSLIAGDVDFVFGHATLVIEDSTLLSRAGRTAGSRGYVLAPSTLPSRRFGFLVTGSRLLAEPGVPPGAVALGRAWDQGVPRGDWRPGPSPNGQALIRDSELGAHLAGWGPSTSQRPFSSTGAAANRFAEYRNTPTQATLRMPP